jgi:hypothetical protein
MANTPEGKEYLRTYRRLQARRKYGTFNAIGGEKRKWARKSGSGSQLIRSRSAFVLSDYFDFFDFSTHNAASSSVTAPITPAAAISAICHAGVTATTVASPMFMAFVRVTE